VWSFFAGICFLVFLLLLIGGVAYGLRLVDPNAEWQFECCIRWYRLRRQEGLDDLKRVRVSRQAKDGDRQSAA
jgi:hypothetical protein